MKTVVGLEATTRTTRGKRRPVVPGREAEAGWRGLEDTRRQSIALLEGSVGEPW